MLGLSKRGRTRATRSFLRNLRHRFLRHPWCLYTSSREPAPCSRRRAAGSSGSAAVGEADRGRAGSRGAEAEGSREQAARQMHRADAEGAVTLPSALRWLRLVPGAAGAGDVAGRAFWLRFHGWPPCASGLGSGRRWSRCARWPSARCQCSRRRSDFEPGGANDKPTSGASTRSGAGPAGGASVAGRGARGSQR